MADSSDAPMVQGVAVVGLAGRFPGADSVAELWANLKAGRESIEVFDPEELAASGISRELVDDPSYVPARGLLRDPEMFDAAFFGIPPREAELMDPQHRLFLETCWHALENAGYAPSGMEGRVGVWGGMSTGMSNDTYLHSNLGGPRGVPEEDVLPAMLGNENDYLTTRVSYKLDLSGPSVNVQTACSTSLVAVVQAFESLLTYGCDVALAGGVSVSYPQKAGYLHQEGGIGSPDGHCRPFDARAAGTVFSNGVGVVVLKRLEDALEDGDTVLAVVRGGATNNDGAAKMSFAAPSVEGQAQVIASAQAVAGVEPGSVTYVETHGTGTPIGDPIEIEGLVRAFRRGTDDTGFCALGSIKSNFGHLDSAAGIAGFIKAVLCLRHRTLVPTVHFTTPTPRVEWGSSPFFVSARTRPWETDRLPRRAGVSAFGIGGTNAHVILEEAPETAPLPPDQGPHLLPLSARTSAALDDAAAGLARELERTREEPGPRLADVAHTLQVGRAPFRHRIAVVAGDVAEAREILAARDPSRLTRGAADSGLDGTVFLFPGGGSQYPAMGRGLYDAFPGLRAEVDRGLELLREREGLDLRGVWLDADDPEEARRALEKPSVQLPAIFILQMAVARLLGRRGVEPTALLGHSMGENTAACLAGVLDYGDALGLVALRGRLFDTAAPGGMLSVTADPGTLEPFLGPELDLAAVNGPEQCTVSGPREPVEALAARLEAEGIDARVVPIDIAAHSALVDPLLEPFEAYLRSVELRPPTIPFLSNLTGRWITDAQATDPGYWASHLRQTVRFADGVRTALDRGRPAFVEVGPGRILSSLVKLSDPSVAPRVTAATRHPRDPVDDERALLGALGDLWVAGMELDWSRIRGDAPVRRIPLPGYPFQRTRHLVEPAREAPARARSGDTPQPGAGEAPPASLAPGPDLLREALELQARTSAAIQALLTRSPAPEAPVPEAPVPAEPEHHAGPTPDPETRAPEGSAPTAPPEPTGLDLSPVPPGPAPAAGEPLEFWREHLRRPLPVLDLLTDAPRSPEPRGRRMGGDLPLPDPVVEAVASLARETGSSPTTVLLAAWAATLHHVTGQDELVMGVSRPGLPLRIRLETGASFAALVDRVGAVWRRAHAHRGPSLEELVEVAGGADDPTRSPLFQTRVLLDGEGPERPGGDAPATPGRDLELVAEPTSVRVAYPEGLFEPATVEGLTSHLVELLSAGVRDPHTSLAALPRAAPGVMDRVARWNATAVELPDARSLAAWLTRAWEERAGQTALVAGDARLDYRELEARSNRLAHHLRASGAGPGTLVGLCLERTADLVVAALAIWKAGAGYVPLDPAYPPARLGLMVDRAGLELVVTAEGLDDRLEGYGGERIRVDRDREAIARRPDTTPPVEGDLTDPAYVIFTSGSTGEPKGVRVPARCVVNFLQAMARRPGLTDDDVLLAVTTLSFDISVLELFLPLLQGGTVVLATSDDARDGRRLAALMEEHGVTVAQATPSTWRLLLAGGWEGREALRALCGGEAFPRDVLRGLLPRVGEVWNMYGPTETTVWSACARLTEPDAPIVIGTPVDNTRCHVLDDAGRPVPPGVPGELHIAGAGVADGYVGRPTETARRFVPESLPPRRGRMYRTGDVVRWRRDGSLEHLRRTDQQVKLRGFRIELGEVEAALAAAPGVRAAAAVLTEVDGGAELAGYVAAEPADWNERELRTAVARRLPAYMVPRFLVRLDDLPLTENGKVDRKALPDPGPAGAAEPHTDGGALEAPATDDEVYLAEVWQEILEIPEIAAHDNFFDLGGHSLLAVRAVTRIQRERGVEVPLRSLITGTLRTIAGQHLTGGEAPAHAGTGEGPPDDGGTVSRVLGTVQGWISR